MIWLLSGSIHDELSEPERCAANSAAKLKGTRIGRLVIVTPVAVHTPTPTWPMARSPGQGTRRKIERRA